MQPQITKLSKQQRALLQLAFECRGNLDAQTALNQLYNPAGFEQEIHSHRVSISRAIGSLCQRGLMRRSLQGQALLTPAGKVFVAEMLNQ